MLFRHCLADSMMPCRFRLQSPDRFVGIGDLYTALDIAHISAMLGVISVIVPETL